MVTFRKILGPAIEVAKKNVKSVLTGLRETRDGQEEGYIPPEPADHPCSSCRRSHRQLHLGSDAQTHSHWYTRTLYFEAQPFSLACSPDCPPTKGLPTYTTTNCS